MRDGYLGHTVAVMNSEAKQSLILLGVAVALVIAGFVLDSGTWANQLLAGGVIAALIGAVLFAHSQISSERD